MVADGRERESDGVERQSIRHCKKNSEVSKELESRESQVLPAEQHRSGGQCKRSHQERVSITRVSGTVEELLSSKVSILSKKTRIWINLGIG